MQPTKNISIVSANRFDYYTGTFADWNDGGKEKPFAVANADEIPASCKNLKTIKACSQKHAMKIVKIAFIVARPFDYDFKKGVKNET